MLINPTINTLKSMKLHGMAKALEAQLAMPDVDKLSFDERFGLLVDHESTHRENEGLQSRLRKAKLRHETVIEDVDLKKPRGIDKTLVAALSSCQWVHKHQNVLITGKAGVGKSFIACALAQKACRDGYTALYERAPRLFEELAVANADGRYGKVLLSICKRDVLILDDFGLTPLTQEQRRHLLEVLEDRYDRKSTIVTSQLPTDNWHDIIGEPTYADAIMDRLIHNAHKLQLTGGSRRKNQGED